MRLNKIEKLSMSELKKVKQIEFVLREFLGIPVGRNPETDWYRSPGIETALGGEEAFDRTDAFREAFPGRTNDPNLINANNRLRVLLNSMVKSNALQRGRLGTYKDYIGEHGSWVYVYYLNDVLFNQLKHKTRTVEDVARSIWVLM